MRVHRGWALPAGLALLAGLAAGADREAGRAGRAIRVILIDGQNNHDWRRTTPVLKGELESSGAFTVDVSSFLKKGERPGEVKAVPFPPELGKYDVLVSNYNGAPWPGEFRKALADRLRAGKIGLVIVHAANNSFGDRLVVDDRGREVRVPRGKGPGSSHGERHPFKVVVRDPDHPVTRGMPREWLHARDELYHGMRGPAHHVHILATAYSDKRYHGTGENEPMIWTVTYGKGRVFHTPMGHDVEAMRCVGFKATLQRGTEWAATGKVTIPLPRDFPTAEKTSSEGK